MTLQLEKVWKQHHDHRRSRVTAHPATHSANAEQAAAILERRSGRCCDQKQRVEKQCRKDEPGEVQAVPRHDTKHRQGNPSAGGKRTRGLSALECTSPCCPSPQKQHGLPTPTGNGEGFGLNRHLWSKQMGKVLEKTELSTCLETTFWPVWRQLWFVFLWRNHCSLKGLRRKPRKGHLSVTCWAQGAQAEGG